MLYPAALYPTALYPTRLFPAAAPAVPAAAYTLSGPASGLTGRPSAPFLVTPDGIFSGTITPADGGAGGVFAPASLGWPGTSGAKSFTYTAAAAGVVAISAADDGGLADPAPLDYAASDPVAAPGDPWAGLVLGGWWSAAE